MQDSLLDLFYKGISTRPVCQCARIPIIGSLKYRILYQTFSKKESLLEVLPAGFSITPPSFFGAPHARFSIRPPLQRNLYWESYMQDSLLDLLYKGISTGSPTCRVLYYICSIMESLLEVIHAGFSITPAIYWNLNWDSYMQDSLLHLLYR